MRGMAALRTSWLGLHALRTVFAYIAVLGLFFGVSRLPLPDVTALSFTQPLFVIVLAAPFLKETVGPARWRAVLFGLLGLLVVVRPGFAEIGLATLAVLLSAICYACTNICVKKLMATDTPRQSVFYFQFSHATDFPGSSAVLLDHAGGGGPSAHGGYRRGGDIYGLLLRPGNFCSPMPAQ